MNYRSFGRLGWKISDVGYGMWGISAGPGGWVGADEKNAMECLHQAVDLGCNFFDTAWIYGRGSGERLLGRLLRERKDKRLYFATKIPPLNREFPSTRTDKFEDLFPESYCDEYLGKSLENIGVDSIDLLQFHVWEDSWAHNKSWQRLVDKWKSQGLIRGIGLSVNRWEPNNCLDTLRTGKIDSVQVIYNIFDQAPEDKLFPLCRELNIGVIARVPFDEGTLTGTLTKDSVWPEGDWRNSYFVPENLNSSVDKVEALKKVVPQGMTLPKLALQFILNNPDVTTTIPGMRSLEHVKENMSVSEMGKLSPSMEKTLREHRWDREPTDWSQ